MTVRSPWRTLLYKELKKVELNGKIIDLGGDRKSKYWKDFKGVFELTVANFEARETGDIKVDLERPFDNVSDSSFDAVLCINVMEHIYNYQNVVSETLRILRPQGKIIFAVPFLIQVHPSPKDHWRYTGDTLERIFKDAGFVDIEVTTVGTGLFGSLAQLSSNACKFAPVRFVVGRIATILDCVVSKLDKKGFYSKTFYPLGYVVKAKI